MGASKDRAGTGLPHTVDWVAFWELLDKLRNQPAMVLGRPDVELLETFLQGYCYGSKNEEASSFLNDFSNFVRKKMKMTSTQGWGRIIAFHSCGEASGMEFFNRLMDEFLLSKGPWKKG